MITIACPAFQVSVFLRFFSSMTLWFKIPSGKHATEKHFPELHSPVQKNLSDIIKCTV